MKKIFCSLLCSVSLISVPVAVFAADISIDSSTIFRFERRDVTGAKKETLMPATQFLGLDADKLADGNLSLHFYGWGRADMGDKSYNSDRADGSFTYGYLRYRFNEANEDIRAGRLFVREGIVNEQLDGISARADLPMGFGVSAFGGATVHTRHLYGEKSDGKGDWIAGGRTSYRYKGMLELGASGLYEGKAPALVNFSNGNHRMLGGDIWLNPLRMLEIMGHTSYNPETKRVAEHSYLINLKPLQHLVLSGEFDEHRDRSYFYSWSMFSKVFLNPSEKSRSAGGGASYEITDNFEMAADYKHYTRDFGNADRYGADARVKFLNNSVRGGIGYHYLRAGSGFAIGTNPSASYHELRAYALHDTKTYFAALDAIDYIFKDKIYKEKSAWEGTVSLGYHITPALALSGDVSYGRNPQFVEEVKGLLRLTYAMTFAGKGDKK
jgi:opacity protein-like surface antigen